MSTRWADMSDDDSNGPITAECKQFMASCSSTDQPESSPSKSVSFSPAAPDVVRIPVCPEDDSYQAPCASADDLASLFRVSDLDREKNLAAPKDFSFMLAELDGTSKTPTKSPAKENVPNQEKKSVDKVKVKLQSSVEQVESKPRVNESGDRQSQPTPDRKRDGPKLRGKPPKMPRLEEAPSSQTEADFKEPSTPFRFPGDASSASVRIVENSPIAVELLNFATPSFGGSSVPASIDEETLYQIGMKMNSETASGRQDEQTEVTEEVWERRIAMRQKQIMIGKSTAEYAYYTASVPREQRRQSTDPMTPNHNDRVSKRRFDGRLNRWRLQMHDWDFEDCERTEKPKLPNVQTTEALFKWSLIERLRTALSLPLGDRGTCFLKNLTEEETKLFLSMENPEFKEMQDHLRDMTEREANGEVIRPRANPRPMKARKFGDKSTGGALEGVPEDSVKSFALID